MIAFDPQVLEAQERLVELRFDPGPVDGYLSHETRTAIRGFQKLNKLPPEGRLDARTLHALDHPRKVRPLVRKGERDRAEVDLDRQLLFVYDRGELRLITHISTGAGRRYCEKGICDRAITPKGDFRVYKRVKGWQRGPLGTMFKPLYFSGGVAMHGSVRVPLRPASHGCVRIPLHSADLVFRLVRKGEAVHVR